MNCETDFVPRSEEFQALVSVVSQAAGDATKSAAEQLTFDSLLASLHGQQTVKGLIDETVGILRENLVLQYVSMCSFIFAFAV